VTQEGQKEELTKFTLCQVFSSSFYSSCSDPKVLNCQVQTYNIAGGNVGKLCNHFPVAEIKIGMGILIGAMGHIKYHYMVGK